MLRVVFLVTALAVVLIASKYSCHVGDVLLPVDETDENCGLIRNIMQGQTSWHYKSMSQEQRVDAAIARAVELKTKANNLSPQPCVTCVCHCNGTTPNKTLVV
jgi:hypothetical protein